LLHTERINRPKFEPGALRRRLSRARAVECHRQVFQVTNRSPGQEGGSRRPLGLAASLAQLEEELLPVLVVPEDRLPLIPATHHVVNRSRILHSLSSKFPLLTLDADLQSHEATLSQIQQNIFGTSILTQQTEMHGKEIFHGKAHFKGRKLADRNYAALDQMVLEHLMGNS
jgi:hypothetical protein